MSRNEHLVRASKPVNRRLAGPVAEPEAIAPESLKARIAKVRASRIGGPPLAQMLERGEAAAHPAQSFGALAVGSAVAITAGGIIAGLGAMQSELLLQGAGAASMALGGGALIARRLLTKPRPEGLQAMPFQGEALARFDEVIENCAHALPQSALESLLDIKANFSRMAPRLSGANTDEHFRAEQQLYLNEVLRRYVPDSLLAYLAVPEAQRPIVLLDNGLSADANLQTQLQDIARELGRIEQGLARSAARGLEQQGAFLNAKHRSGS